jgi:hypothetical protein
MRVLNTKTGDERMDFQSVNAASYIKAGSSVIPIGRRINFGSLPSCSYRLEVWASDPTGKRTVWRTADSTIE